MFTNAKYVHTVGPGSQNHRIGQEDVHKCKVSSHSGTRVTKPWFCEPVPTVLQHHSARCSQLKNMLTQWEKCPIHWNLSCICVYRWPKWLRIWKIAIQQFDWPLYLSCFTIKWRDRAWVVILFLLLCCMLVAWMTKKAAVLLCHSNYETSSNFLRINTNLALHPTSGGYIQVYRQPNEVSTCRLHKLNPVMCPCQCMKFHTVMPDLTKKWLFSYTNLQLNTNFYLFGWEYSSHFTCTHIHHYLCPRHSIMFTVLVVICIRHEVWLSLCVLVTAGYALTVVWNVKYHWQKSLWM